MNHYKEQLNEVNKKIAQKDDEIKFFENDLKQYIEIATEISPRIETKRQAKQIETEIQKIELQIKITEKKFVISLFTIIK